MRTIICSLLLTVSMLFSGITTAVPFTILDQQSFWDYNVTATNYGAGGLASETYSDFLLEYTGVSNGQAGFGNTTPPVGGATNTNFQSQ